MFRLRYTVLLADLILVVALYFVLQDLSWRSYYALAPHDRCGGLCSYTPSTSYSLLTRFFTMAGNGVSLTSPPTLDWVQILAVVLVALNGWYLYSELRARRGEGGIASQPVPQGPVR